jgi:hypothetical protein
MGTSKSLSTPKGGKWTSVKNDVTNLIGGDNRVSPIQIIQGTLRAAGGINMPRVRGGRVAPATGAGTAPGTGVGVRGGGRSGGGGGSRSGSPVGGAVSGLGGFGQAVRSEGLDRALEVLGVAQLKGRPAAEVVAEIAEHIAGQTEGPQRELLTDALRNALFEAAALQNDGSYENLKEALDQFLQRDGVEGLIELFLTAYVFDRVWMLVENHVDLKTQSNGAADAMGVAVENACRSNVADLIADSKASGTFEAIDWFGNGGQAAGEQLVADLEARLTGNKQ